MGSWVEVRRQLYPTLSTESVKNSGGCPVHAEFDPLGEEYLRDPFALMDDLPPVFFAPTLDYYVVTRYADIERVFLDPDT